MYILNKSTQPHVRKYLNIHNSNLVYHTVDQQHEGRSSTQIQFSRRTQICKIQKIKKKLIIFLLVWIYGCKTHQSPGKNSKTWSTNFILRLCQSNVVFCLQTLNVGLQTLCASVLQAGTSVHKIQKSALLSSLCSSVYQHKWNVLLHDTVFMLLLRVSC